MSSPGLDKPLKDFRQYIKNIGRHLKLKHSDGREMEGELLTADQDKIVLKEVRKERIEGRKKKETIEEDHVITYPQIKQAKIKILFK